MRDFVDLLGCLYNLLEITNYSFRAFVSVLPMYVAAYANYTCVGGMVGVTQKVLMVTYNIK